MEKQWFVVHTYSGYENKVKTNLEKRLESMGMEDKIFRVLVPEDEETEIKNGKRKTAKKKVFPGYVLAEMVMTDDSWYVVRNTPGVTGFVGSAGSGTKPTPLLEEEVEVILKRMGMNDAVMEVDFEIKESVRVIDGPFKDFTGAIEHIDPDRQKVKVHVNMFGRETPVELDFTQITKL
ncbi:transcription termination/antitermination protein NusG [Paraliobacillus sp. JSM ZJ581]|uniref:transcription termination/antitermination protein NusG n=1 Tax=Paraliobacillus sp. JSM ZJ581 TaxID=3342118 RepID=UPI0035A8371C